MKIEMSMGSVKDGCRARERKNEEGYHVKKITRACILSLVFVLTFMFFAASVEVAAAGCFIPQTDKDHVLIQGIQI